MCSNVAAALASIISAIDELASDAGGDVEPAELAERVARLWAMVAELDPELARRWSGYEDRTLGSSADGHHAR